MALIVLALIVLTSPYWDSYSEPETTALVTTITFFLYLMVNLIYFLCTILFCIKGAIIFLTFVMVCGFFTHLLNFMICMNSPDRHNLYIAYIVFCIIDLGIQITVFLYEKSLKKSFSSIENAPMFILSNVSNNKEQVVLPNSNPPRST